MPALGQNSVCGKLFAAYIDSKHSTEKMADFYLGCLKRFAKSLSVDFDSAILSTDEDVRKWRDDKTYADSTKRADYYFLRSFFTFAVEKGLIPENPFSKIALSPQMRKGRPKARERFEAIELTRIVECVKERATDKHGCMIFAIVCLMVFNGIGPSAIIKLKIEDYVKNNRGAYIVINGSRAGIETLNAITISALDGYLAYRWGAIDEAPLFARLQEENGCEIPYRCSKSISNKVGMALSRAGVYRRGVSIIVSRNELQLLTCDSVKQMGEMLKTNVTPLARNLKDEVGTRNMLSPNERIEYGMTIREDVVKGVVSREELEHALSTSVESGKYTFNVRYDGEVFIEPFVEKR